MDRLSTRTIDALYFVHQFLSPYFFFPLKQPGYEKGFGTCQWGKFILHFLLSIGEVKSELLKNSYVTHASQTGKISE